MKGDDRNSPKGNDKGISFLAPLHVNSNDVIVIFRNSYLSSLHDSQRPMTRFLKIYPNVAGYRLPSHTCGDFALVAALTYTTHRINNGVNLDHQRSHTACAAILS